MNDMFANYAQMFSKSWNRIRCTLLNSLIEFLKKKAHTYRYC